MSHAASLEEFFLAGERARSSDLQDALRTATSEPGLQVYLGKLYYRLEML